MKIVLGSTNVHKLDAVRLACEKICVKAEISGVKALSGQNEQPVGFKEIFDGAMARVSFAKTNDPGDSVYIGIESGIVNLNRMTAVDMAVVIILAKERRIVTTSTGIEFPQSLIAVAYHRGFANTTVGSVIAEKIGGDATDPHSTLTHGYVSRKQTLVDALVLALCQL